MEFIETTIFTRQIKSLISEESYRAMQSAMLQQPDIGDVMQGTGGGRKMRWAYEGRGKSYGIRVIYALKGDKVFMLLTYEKSRKGDLTPDQRRALKQLIEQLE